MSNHPIDDVAELELAHSKATEAFLRGECQTPEEIIAEMEGSSVRKQQVFTRYAKGEITLGDVVDQIRDIRPRPTWFEQFFRTIIALLAILLLCVSASADGPFPPGTRLEYQGRTVIPHGLRIIETRQDSGDSVTAATPARADGPLFSIWHIDGHGYQWQQQQIDAGTPLEPSVRLIASAQRDNPNWLAKLNADSPILSQWNHRAIALRMNNIGRELDRTIPRLNPTDEATARLSHMCVRIKEDGTLDETPTVSPFAGTAAWTEAGRRWATSLWMQRLQEIIPEPSGIILRENNEGARLSVSLLYLDAGVKRLNSKGQLVQAAPGDNPSTYVYADTVAPWTWFINDAGKLRAYRWKTDRELDATVDLRAKEWVAPLRSTQPWTNQAALSALEIAQYHSLYGQLDANSAPGWQGKFGCRTVGYGGFHENHQNSTASGSFYLGFFRPRILTARTIAAGQTGDYYDWSANFRDECVEHGADWRELSIGINKRPIFEGAVAGEHAAVDPQSYAGLMTWVAWVLQSPGKEVRLVGWESYLTKPSERLFADTDAELLNSIGRPDLLTVTIEEYELAVLRQLDRIHDHPVLNRYWREGTTTVLPCPLNDQTTVKVYATETTIPGIQQTLLCVYTPCDLTGEMQVGEWTVPAKRCAYYLTGSVVEVE